MAVVAAGCGDAPGGDVPRGDAPGADAPRSDVPAADAPRGNTPGGDTAAVPGEAPGTTGAVVEIWFSRGEEPVSVERRVGVADPEAALSALVAGPTAAERAAGLGSWFSDSTAGALAGVELRDGFLVVDFTGLSRLIPGAGSSAGSSQLLASLDSTVFQFGAVDSVEYRLDGSCGAFWEWLQRGCEVVSRP